ncbi:LVIVD repeat-containing protein [Haloarchaeobius iranensis]|uniref:PGF-CTERM protein n=1 Tax=Haloarchaeobius iranensis TaxID=996166 RepID=A0A1G9SA68_9EURY|nr:PGF-CTERM sorting domain-containing protein [Haloarchaeobius iranensis]SDM32403.1 PGF-CTERM protein [Haloarchaeobius iranensis]
MVLHPTDDSADRVGRRGVLAGLAGVAAAGVAGTTVTASRPTERATSLEPTAELAIEGLCEAVVSEDGETVFAATRDGFATVDVSDPANPALLYEERGLTHDGQGPMQRVYDVKYADDRLVVAGPNAGGRGELSGFFLYDVEDPANPERLAFQPTNHAIHNCFFDGTHAYLTGSGVPNEPTMIYDVTGDAPEQVGEWTAVDEDDAWRDAGRNYLSCHDVYVQDDRLYVAYWDAGTWVVDIADRANPTAVAKLGGHTAEYLAGVENGFTAEFVELPGNSHYVQPNADASAVYVGKEAWDREDTSDHDGGPGGIELWSMGDEPTRETILAPPEDNDGATSHNFGVRDDRLYTSWYGGGVQVYDVADRTAPRLLGGWRADETTSFWTAEPIHEGFVGASYQNPENDREERRQGVGARLLLFPEPEGEGEPAPTMEPRPVPETGSAGDTDTPTTRPPDSGGSEGGTAGRTTTTGNDDTAGTTDGGSPGFGVLAALAGVGAAAGLARRRPQEEE